MNTENKIILSEDLKQRLIEEKTIFTTARSSKLQESVAIKILEKIQQNYELNSTEEALTVISILFQQGGTSRSCDGNMSIRIFDKDFKLANIRKCMEKVTHPKSERKLARTFADKIHQISAIMEIPGNLYQKIQKQDLERTFEVSEKV